jgi:hypothetical protein
VRDQHGLACGGPSNAILTSSPLARSGAFLGQMVKSKSMFRSNTPLGLALPITPPRPGAESAGLGACVEPGNRRPRDAGNDRVPRASTAVASHEDRRENEMGADWKILPVMAVIFLAMLIRSAFGFGEALVAVPLLALLMPVEEEE